MCTSQTQDKQEPNSTQAWAAQLKLNLTRYTSWAQGHKLKLTSSDLQGQAMLKQQPQYNLNLSSIRGWANLELRSRNNHANIKPISS